MTSSEFDFSIRTVGAISQCFLERGIRDFNSAVGFVHGLPYGRNVDKDNLLTVFSDCCGTCSTKHALLKQLAIEEGIEGVQLMLCIYKMGVANTPAARKVLERYGLPYLPEAHNYLRINGDILDVTRHGWSIVPYQDDIVSEIEIAPGQITEFKVAYHKQGISNWLTSEPSILYSAEELLAIREECIAVFGS
jgi:hypothetical protein